MFDLSETLSREIDLLSDELRQWVQARYAAGARPVPMLMVLNAVTHEQQEPRACGYELPTYANFPDGYTGGA